MEGMAIERGHVVLFGAIISSTEYFINLQTTYSGILRVPGKEKTDYWENQG